MDFLLSPCFPLFSSPFLPIARCHTLKFPADFSPCSSFLLSTFSFVFAYTCFCVKPSFLTSLIIFSSPNPTFTNYCCAPFLSLLFLSPLLLVFPLLPPLVVLIMHYLSSPCRRPLLFIFINSCCVLSPLSLSCPSFLPLIMCPAAIETDGLCHLSF